MGKFGILEIAIVLGIIFVKFAIIIGAALYVKRRNERKKQQFLEDEMRRRAAMSAKSDAENQ